MFARSVHFRLKSLDLAAEFAQTLKNEILPLLRKQRGFKGEITLSNPGDLERISISLLKIFSKVIDGAPKIRTFEAVALDLDYCQVAERQNS